MPHTRPPSPEMALDHLEDILQIIAACVRDENYVPDQTERALWQRLRDQLWHAHMVMEAVCQQVERQLED